MELAAFVPSLLSLYKFWTLHPPSVPQLLRSTALLLPLCK